MCVCYCVYLSWVITQGVIYIKEYLFCMSYLDDVKVLVDFIDSNRDRLVVSYEYDLERVRDLLVGIKDKITVSKRKL